MRDIKRILCPVDFSDASAHAIEQAIALAAWCKGSITALHVFSPIFAPVPGLPPLEERASPVELAQVRDRVAASFESAAAARVRVDVCVEVGTPAHLILDCAERLSADAIVIGTHGTGGFEHLVLGSVTEKVLRKATCAVLTVPPRVQATSSLPFARVLCPVDFSDPSLTALEAASSLVRSFGAALTLLHVVEWPWPEPPAPAAGDVPEPQASALRDYRRYVEKSALMRLETLAQGAGLVPAPSLSIVHGRSYVEILRAAARIRADLIVIGLHGRNVLDLALFGSTTNHVVREARCPVLTLRH
jgi:nucleotide-binding universal stress UspA family protein